MKSRTCAAEGIFAGTDGENVGEAGAEEKKTGVNKG